MSRRTTILIGILAIGLCLTAACCPQDKAVYSKGETVEFRIDQKVVVFSEGFADPLPYFILDGEGMQMRLRHWCDPMTGTGYDQYCQNGVAHNVSVINCTEPFWGAEFDIHQTFTWDQKAYQMIAEECGGRTIYRDVPQQVPSGNYTIVVWSDTETQSVIKEFTIE